MMNAADEQALRDVVARLEATWNNGDSVGWTEQFAEDADFIHILGGHFNGQTAIERGHRAIFDTIYKGSTNKFAVEKMRSIGDDAAIVFLYAELRVTTPGLPPLLNARPTLVAQRTGDGWKIVTFQNTLITTEGAPAGKDALAKGVASALNSAVAEQHPIKGTAKAAGN
jgi:uncharacterized protein (TIGR02246 family)